MAVAVAGEPHKSARGSLGQLMLGDQPADGRALGLWGYRFTARTLLSACMSGCAQQLRESGILSLALAQPLRMGTSMPPNLERHL